MRDDGFRNFKKRRHSSREDANEISNHPCPEGLIFNHRALPRARSFVQSISRMDQSSAVLARD